MGCSCLAAGSDHSMGAHVATAQPSHCAAHAFEASLCSTSRSICHDTTTGLCVLYKLLCHKGCFTAARSLALIDTANAILVWHVGVYNDPPYDPEHLISSAASRAEAQSRSKQLADSVLVKALKVSVAFFPRLCPILCVCVQNAHMLMILFIRSGTLESC